MTEAEWQTATNPQPMLGLLKKTASDRKLRLFACACCRRIWHLLTDERSRRAVEEAERYAEGISVEGALFIAGLGGDEAVAGVLHRRQSSEHPIPEMFILAARAARSTTYPEFETEGASAVVSACSLISRNPDSSIGSREVVQADCSLILREMFGNPFRPVAVDPSWLTSTALELARQMYESRDFSPMPILGDALQDAGCDNDDVLNHCRQPGEHVRGCWVVDLILGKK